MGKAEGTKTHVEKTETEENRLGTSGHMDNLKKYPTLSDTKDASHNVATELDLLIADTFNVKKQRRKKF